ncbi:MAG: hypothetical protein AAGF95_27870 [Chloroflexota bacterium]
MQINREHILTKIAQLEAPLVAIEALWDGDTAGWYVCLSAATSDQQSHLLTVLQEGGDLRLFNDQVPPWPEARAAQTLGNELAQQFGVAFYFPSPEHPEDNCPSWWDRDQGYPCRRCQILILQRDDCPWRGVCYHCHLKEEREQREAS